MEKNYNLYSLIGIGRNASEEAIANRIERIKRLKNDYSEELFKKIEEEYKLFLEDRNLYDKKIGINSDKNIDDNQQEDKKTYYTSNTFKSSEEKSDNIGVVDKSGVDKTYDPMFDDQYAFVKLANESYLKKKKEENDIINQREAERSYKIYKDEKNKRKQAKNLKLKKVVSIVVCGVIVFVGAMSVSNLIKKNNNNKNKLNNVCVEYEVKNGDTKSDIDDIFGEYGFSYYEVSGPYRNSNLIYAGDVIVGITTKEEADKLVEEGRGKIISVDYAIELLSENNSLTPKLKEYQNGKSNLVFYIPTSYTK